MLREVFLACYLMLRSGSLPNTASAYNGSVGQYEDSLSEKSNPAGQLHADARLRDSVNTVHRVNTLNLSDMRHRSNLDSSSRRSVYVAVVSIQAGGSVGG